jgi:preprotein translocase subunit YajC
MLAQATSQPTSGAATRVNPLLQFLPWILMIVVFYFIIMRGSRKDQQRQKNMLASLKRNDRVQTIGGIRGTIVDVREDEIVVKVDESNNVKMRFARGAVKEVLSSESPPAK